MLGCQAYSDCEAKKLTSHSLPLDHIVLRSYREVMLDRSWVTYLATDWATSDCSCR
jgi:hypothetical protein